MKIRSVFVAILIGSSLFLSGLGNLSAQAPSLVIRGPSYEQNLERWNKFTDAEKVRIITNYKKWKSLSPSRQDLIRKRYNVFRTLSNEQRETLKLRADGRIESPAGAGMNSKEPMNKNKKLFLAVKSQTKKTPGRPQNIKNEKPLPQYLKQPKKIEDQKESMDRPGRWEMPARVERQGRNFISKPFERREMPERTLRPGRN